jgi:hypothetical protein
MEKPNKFIRFAKYHTGREPPCEMHRCRQNGCGGRYSETRPKVSKISREFEVEDVYLYFNAEDVPGVEVTVSRLEVFQ